MKFLRHSDAAAKIEALENETAELEAAAAKLKTRLDEAEVRADVAETSLDDLTAVNAEQAAKLEALSIENAEQAAKLETFDDEVKAAVVDQVAAIGHEPVEALPDDEPEAGPLSQIEQRNRRYAELRERRR